MRRAFLDDVTHIHTDFKYIKIIFFIFLNLIYINVSKQDLLWIIEEQFVTKIKYQEFKFGHKFKG
jgi:hypothetical protein